MYVYESVRLLCYSAHQLMLSSFILTIAGDIRRNSIYSLFIYKPDASMKQWAGAGAWLSVKGYSIFSFNLDFIEMWLRLDLEIVNGGRNFSLWLFRTSFGILVYIFFPFL